MKAKYLKTYSIKTGIFKVFESLYEYRGYTYSIQLTHISHIDQASHQMNQSHIDNIIKHKEIGSNMTETAQESINNFFESLENKGETK